MAVSTLRTSSRDQMHSASEAIPLSLHLQMNQLSLDWSLLRQVPHHSCCLHQQTLDLPFPGHLLPFWFRFWLWSGSRFVQSGWTSHPCSRACGWWFECCFFRLVCTFYSPARPPLVQCTSALGSNETGPLLQQKLFPQDGQPRRKPCCSDRITMSSQKLSPKKTWEYHQPFRAFNHTSCYRCRLLW